jgi:hypothetical protein
MRLTFRGIDSSWLELRLGTFLKHFTSLVYETKIQEVGDSGVDSSWLKLRLDTFLKHFTPLVYETNIQGNRLLMARTETGHFLETFYPISL